MDEAITVRPARADEAGTLTELAMRAKASWGYDAAFMAACREELTLTPQKMAAWQVWVAEQLITAADSLAHLPLRGREIAPGLRQLAHLSPYLLRYSYDPLADVVTIRTIWHGARGLG